MAAVPVLPPEMPRHVAQTRLTAAFRAAACETPALDARLLLCDALGTDHAGLVRDADAPLGHTARRLAVLVERRLAGEPVARILGRREFFGLPFTLGPDTLDPRADTETLVEVALHLLGDARDTPLRLLDLGTGSGAILAALLSRCPGAYGVGVDRAPGACATAAANLEALGLAARAALLCGDWTAPLAGTFDLVVSNPPYIASGEIAALARDVRDHDPHLALDGGADGLHAYRAIVPAAAMRLRPGGSLVVEVGVGQADAVAALLRGAGFAAIGTRRDLGGHIRVVHGRKARA